MTGSLALLESWFRAASRSRAGLTLTPQQCARIAEEIRLETTTRLPQPVEHEGAA